MTWGGKHGYRIWWPAGLEQLTPKQRAEALERGWWTDAEGYTITREGLRIAPVDESEEASE